MNFYVKIAKNPDKNSTVVRDCHNYLSLAGEDIADIMIN